MQDASTQVVIAEPTAFPVGSGRTATSKIGLATRAGVLFARVFAAGAIVITSTLESLRVSPPPVTCDAPLVTTPVVNTLAQQRDR